MVRCWRVLCNKIRRPYIFLCFLFIRTHVSQRKITSFYLLLISFHVSHNLLYLFLIQSFLSLMPHELSVSSPPEWSLCHNTFLNFLRFLRAPIEPLLDRSVFLVVHFPGPHPLTDHTRSLLVSDLSPSPSSFTRPPSRTLVSSLSLFEVHLWTSGAAPDTENETLSTF